MRYEPSWSLLRRACPPGQEKNLRSDAANLPWLVMDLQQSQPDLFDAWVEHVKMALPNLIAIEAIQRDKSVCIGVIISFLFPWRAWRLGGFIIPTLL